MASALTSPTPRLRDPGDLDRLLEQFDSAWRQESPPQIEAFLLPALAGGSIEANALRWELVEELVRIDLEYRWRFADGLLTPPVGPRRPLAEGGVLPGRPCLEDYLVGLPELGRLEDLPLGLIGEEYWVRHRFGDCPSHAEYEARFAAHHPRLREVLAQVDARLAAEQFRQNAARHPVAALVCPHCHHAVEHKIESGTPEIHCQACGVSFRVDASAPASSPAGLPPFTQIGRYHLVKLLGTGTFGTVWSAWDTQLDRDVAVKLPRSGQWTHPAQEERFLREARSTAQLKHPHIVTVHDVGQDRQTIYLVADLVPGVSLAEWIKERQFSFRQSAELMAQVADALAYAHRQGVIHRDLKPSNILLERASGAGEPAVSLSPKITDFGLAKRELGEITLTLEGEVLGTPAYMSPEQIRNPHAVDGRSDLYSIGVILYQLLTGELPFRGVTRMLLEQVQYDEPRPPRRLNDKIPRDLETITLKCLAKEPERRYPTADELAADLRRWVAGEPIHARPVGRVARLSRWCRRKPVLAGLLAALVVVFLGGLGGVTWQWRLAERNRAQAEANAEESDALRRQAEEALAATSQAVHQYFVLAEKAPSKTDLSEQKRIADAELDLWLRLLGQRPGDAALQASAASVYFRLGALNRQMKRYAEALAALEKGRVLQEELARSSPAVAYFHATLANVDIQIGMIQNALGRPDLGLQACHRALSRQEQLIAGHPDHLGDKLVLAIILTEIGNSHRHAGHLVEAFRHYHQASRVVEQLRRADPKAVAFQYQLAGVRSGIGQSWSHAACIARAARSFPDFSVQLLGGAGQVGASVRAAGWFQETTQQLEELLRAYPDNLGMHVAAAETWHRLGNEWKLQGRRDEALRAYRQGGGHYRLVWERNPDSDDIRLALGKHYLLLGQLQRDVNRPAEAAMTAQAYQDLCRTGAEYYIAARELALFAHPVEENEGDDPAEVAGERRQREDLAMTALRQAVRNGFHDLESLKKDRGLEAIRFRDDFRELLAELEKQPPGKAP
jgi:tetratricopeptide (TPR) repeat protein